jgi:hypothetical protein
MQVVLKFGKETALTGAPSPATKLADKPTFVPLKPPETYLACYPMLSGWITFNIEISPTQKRRF